MQDAIARLELQRDDEPSGAGGLEPMVGVLHLVGLERSAEGGQRLVPADGEVLVEEGGVSNVAGASCPHVVVAQDQRVRHLSVEHAHAIRRDPPLMVIILVRDVALVQGEGDVVLVPVLGDPLRLSGEDVRERLGAYLGVGQDGECERGRHGGTCSGLVCGAMLSGCEGGRGRYSPSP